MKRFGLSANERIKSRKDFEVIFSEGKTIFSSDKKIKATYFVEENIEVSGIKIAAAVNKKAGKAVWRNRIKRLVRAIYRQNKEEILEKCHKKKYLLKIVFSPYMLNEKKNKQVLLDDLKPGILEILLKLKRSL